MAGFDLVSPEIRKYVKKLKQPVCEYDRSFIDTMNEKSKEICDHILKFEWTISFDGRDYISGVPQGCQDATTIRTKQDNRKKGKNICTCGRNHAISIKVFTELVKLGLSADSLEDALKQLRAPDGIFLLRYLKVMLPLPELGNKSLYLWSKLIINQ